MGYSKDNLALLVPVPFSGAWRMWVYRSADNIATVRAAGYISNASDMGMLRHDTVLVVDTANHLQYWFYVAGITAGAADLTDGTQISATNT